MIDVYYLYRSLLFVYSCNNLFYFVDIFHKNILQFDLHIPKSCLIVLFFYFVFLIAAFEVLAINFILRLYKLFSATVVTVMLS